MIETGRGSRAKDGAVRIGDLAYAGEPGEAFPEVSAAIRNSIKGMRSVNVIGMAYDELGYYWPTGYYTAADFVSSDFDKYNISPEIAQQSVDAATASAKRIGLKTVPATVAPDHLVPNALILQGIQFFPTIVESSDPTVQLYPSARKASAPPESGQSARSISQIVVINDPPVAAVKIKKPAETSGTTRVINRRRKRSKVCLNATFVDSAGNVATHAKAKIAVPQLKERPRH